MNETELDINEIEKKIDDYENTLKKIIIRSNPLGTEGDVCSAIIKNKKFKKIQLYNRTFENCDFSNVSFNGSFFEGAIFINCLFVKTTFFETTLRNVKFKNCNISTMNFNKSIIDNVRFDYCSLQDIYIFKSAIGDFFFINSKIRNIDCVKISCGENSKPFKIICCRVNLGAIIEFLNFDYILKTDTERAMMDKKRKLIYVDNLLPYDTKRVKRDNKIFKKVFLKNLKPIEEVLNEDNFPKYRIK
jgi:hypothetical protein